MTELIMTERFKLPLLKDLKGEGVDHLNIYSKSKFNLGRNLSHFSDLGFDFPGYGYFNSMEGFWYWLKTGKKHDQLKELIGYQAKAFGRIYDAVQLETFQQEIMMANWFKVCAYPWLMDDMLENQLPFDHYYVNVWPNGTVYVRPNGAGWLCAGFKEITKALREKRGVNFDFLSEITLAQKSETLKVNKP